MSTEPKTEPAEEDERHDEVEQLRARVAALEDEVADRAARTNDALAAAQDRTYWLDRWHLDLNALMRRPVMARLWRLMPMARGAYRGVRNTRNALDRARLERRLGGSPDETGERRQRIGLAGVGEAEARERLSGIERVTRRGEQLELRLGREDVSPRWVLENAAGAWEIVEFRPGAGGETDLYVLRRR
jgi:hypothetical protein